MRRQKFVSITPFLQNFCLNFWSDNKEKVSTKCQNVSFRISFQEHISVKSLCEQSILAVGIAKFGPFREPIRMLLFTLDQFSRIIEAITQVSKPSREKHLPVARVSPYCVPSSLLVCFITEQSTAMAFTLVKHYYEFIVTFKACYF